MNRLLWGDRIVVTGGAGFIGTHLVHELVDQASAILLIDDFRHACGVEILPNVDVLNADICSPKAKAAIEEFEPRTVIHLAAQGGVRRSRHDPAGDALTNIVGTVNIASAALVANCPRLIFASSGGAIYGHAPIWPTPETIPPAPISPYGTAKLAAEKYLAMFANDGNLSVLSLRFGNVYGPYQDGTGEAGVVAISSTRLTQQQPPIIRGSGDQTRDFIYVGDVVEAIMAGMNSQVTGALNIGTEQATSVRQVVDHLCKQANYRGEIIFEAPNPEEVPHCTLDCTLAQRKLGWTAATSLSSGLTQTYTYFANNSQLIATA